MLEQGSSILEPDVITKPKETVYSQLVRHVAVEGYPAGNNEYKETSMNDLVYAMISPIIYKFNQEKRAGGKPVYLRRALEVIAGKGDFIVLDLISALDRLKYTYFLVIEGKGLLLYK